MSFREKYSNHKQMKIGKFAIIAILLVAAIGLFFVFNPSILDKNRQNQGDNQQAELISQENSENDQESYRDVPTGDIDTKKQVKVDLSQQKAFLFENGQLVREYNISSGLSETPTPKGEYRIVYKQDNLYSKIAGCWLSYWAGFTSDGLYGFHETPVCDGIREGEEDIGKPASHGCIRLKTGDASDFYSWIENYTPIEIY